LPHESVTVQFLVTERSQPVPTSAAMVPVATRFGVQLSVTVAVPKAAAISACVGLQSRSGPSVNVITGFSVSIFQVKVCEHISVLPQASVAV